MTSGEEEAAATVTRGSSGKEKKKKIILSRDFPGVNAVDRQTQMLKFRSHTVACNPCCSPGREEEEGEGNM